MKENQPELPGRDGFRVRDNGEWGIEKLEFIDAFGPQALLATKSKLSRHYVDLFAGPGMNRIRGRQQEFDGSPLRALELTAQGNSAVSFTNAVFLNLDPLDHAALQARVQRRISEGKSRIPASQVVCTQGDANVLVRDVMAGIHPRAFAFVFADMEAPKQFPWTTVQALVERGHQSVDFYMLLPLDMGLKRLISSNPKTVEQCSGVLTAFYGSEEWRPLLEHRKGSGYALGADAQALYIKQLKGLWKYAGEV
ncbi:MAG: three-Cys-motif partner protein, partial [Gemmatimonadetes bacterium]|nr:three-Cys-motif partner protein [Gemmatimonadota bacterium]